MAFAAGLSQLLDDRGCQIASEFDRGDSLEAVLDRHLLAVEQMAERELLTSVLLLSRDGTRLFHGAAPSLPQAYRDSIDGSKIGPSAGSCGTAAYFERPVYVADIAADPLWADYRHLALAHGLRSCWSTPIRDGSDRVIGTFAIYHRTPGIPAADELAAIEMIAAHVAHAIVRAREAEGDEESLARSASRLMLVADNPQASDQASDALEGLLLKAARLEELAERVQEQMKGSDSEDFRAEMDAVAKDTRKLAAVIRRQIEEYRRDPKPND
jgi:GAF domain-containing protein